MVVMIIHYFVQNFGCDRKYFEYFVLILSQKNLIDLFN